MHSLQYWYSSCSSIFPNVVMMDVVWSLTLSLLNDGQVFCYFGVTMYKLTICYLVNATAWPTTYQSINQSINQTSIAPISPVKPAPVAQQPNQCSTAKSRKQFMPPSSSPICNVYLQKQHQNNSYKCLYILYCTQSTMATVVFGISLMIIHKYGRQGEWANACATSEQMFGHLTVCKQCFHSVWTVFWKDANWKQNFEINLMIVTWYLNSWRRPKGEKEKSLLRIECHVHVVDFVNCNTRFSKKRFRLYTLILKSPIL